MTTGGRCGCWQRRWENGRIGDRISKGRGVGVAGEGDHQNFRIQYQADYSLTMFTESPNTSSTAGSRCLW